MIDDSFKPRVRRRGVVLTAAASVLGSMLGCERNSVEPSAQSAALSASASPGLRPPKLRIAAGSKSGNYFKAAQELNGVLAATDQLTIEETAGSYDNINKLGSGEAELAIAQFDALKAFLKMGDRRAKMAQSALVIAPLAPELVHIVVATKAGIETLADLKGKRISVGPEQSGTWLSAWSVMFYMNDVNIETHKEHIEHSDYEESLDKVSNGELDAMFITTARGMPLLTKLGAEAGMHLSLLSLGDDFQIPEAVLSTYLIEVIVRDTYPWQKEAVSTLATPSYLLANKDLPAERVERLAAAIYGHADELKKKSALWKYLDKARVSEDLKSHIPYHPGVRSYLSL